MINNATLLLFFFLLSKQGTTTVTREWLTNVVTVFSNRRVAVHFFFFLIVWLELVISKYHENLVRNRQVFYTPPKQETAIIIITNPSYQRVIPIFKRPIQASGIYHVSG